MQYRNPGSVCVISHKQCVLWRSAFKTSGVLVERYVIVSSVFCPHSLAETSVFSVSSRCITPHVIDSLPCQLVLLQITFQFTDNLIDDLFYESYC